MKRLSFITLLLAGLLCGKCMTMQAQTLKIGTNDSKTYYAPVYATWADKYYCSQILYSEGELSKMKGSEIKRITFFLRKANTSGDYEHVQIRLKTVNYEVFADKNYEPVDDAVLVFDGTLAASQGTELDAVLTKSFVYTGGTLLVDVRKVEEGGGYAPSSGDAGRFQSTFNEGVYTVLYNYDKNALPTTASQSANRPDIQFTFSEATGVENVQTNKVQGTKVIENGILHLMYNGTKYNVQGGRVN